jgi:hypothetical protein
MIRRDTREKRINSTKLVALLNIIPTSLLMVKKYIERFEDNYLVCKDK